MTKTICDICGKEMPPASKFANIIGELNFCISSHGRIWDICDECRVSLNQWMTIRKEKAVSDPMEKPQSDSVYGTGELYPGEFESRHYDFEEEQDV